MDLRRLLAQAGIDAAEHKVVERLQRVLLEELHHRVKNTLAIVMAITSQSLRAADSLEHGREAINHRLMALGRVHDLLLQTSWGSTSLAEILKIAIDPFDTSGAGRFLVQSSDIEVSSEAVLPLAMVLNELCTNAVKYGALSNETGRGPDHCDRRRYAEDISSSMGRDRRSDGPCANPSQLRNAAHRTKLRETAARRVSIVFRAFRGRLCTRNSVGLIEKAAIELTPLGSSRPTSASGHERHFGHVRVMSALPFIATKLRTWHEVG